MDAIPSYKIFNDAMLVELDRIQESQQRMICMAKMYPDIISDPQKKVKQIIQNAVESFIARERNY